MASSIDYDALLKDEPQSSSIDYDSLLNEPKVEGKGFFQKASDMAVAAFDAPTKITNAIIDSPIAVVKGLAGGLVKHRTVGEVYKGIGDMDLEKANKIKTEIDSSIAPEDQTLLGERLKFQKSIKSLNETMKNPELDQVARDELNAEILKSSEMVSNIDKQLMPKVQNYNEIIKKFEDYSSKVDVGNRKRAVGENLMKQHERILNTFTTAEERDSFAYKLGSGVESMAEAFAISAVVPGAGLAKGAGLVAKGVKVARGTVPGLALSLPGAVDMYDKAVGKGMKPNEARLLGMSNLAVNTALEGLGFSFIFKGPAKGMVKSFITEAAQEAAQTLSDNAMTKAFIDENQSLWEGIVESAAIGGIIGGSVGKIRSNIEESNAKMWSETVKNNPKIKEAFAKYGMDEAAIDKLLATAQRNTVQLNEVVSEKTFTDEFNKLTLELSKEQPEDAVRRKPLSGDLDLNDPRQIEQAIADKNRIIAENEGNTDNADLVALAVQKRNDLAEKFQDVTNRPNIDLALPEISTVQADVKESTGVELTREQAAAIVRQMSDERIGQIREQDQSVADTGKTIQVRNEVGELQGFLENPSQRRDDLKDIGRDKLKKIDFQKVADKDLIEGHNEGGVFVPPNTNYIYAKAVKENDPVLLKKVVDNADKHVAFILEGTGIASNIQELGAYFDTLTKQVEQDGSQEVKDEYERIKADIQEIKRISETAQEATRALEQSDTESGETPSAVPESRLPERETKGTGQPKPPVVPESKPAGPKDAKRMSTHLLQSFARSLRVSIQAVDKFRKESVQGQAFTEHGFIRIKRALWKGEWGAVTKEQVGEKNFERLQLLGIIDANGAVDITKYSGRLGQLNEYMADVIPAKEIEALNVALLKSRTTDKLSEVMAHEIGHMIDASPDFNIDRGNIIGRLLSGLRDTRQEDIDIIGTNKELKKELIGLAEWWSPYDKATAGEAFVRYRNKAEELYADSLSAYINDPVAAKKRAPMFFENFEKNMYRKPGLKEAFDEMYRIQNLKGEALEDYYLKESQESSIRSEQDSQKAYELKNPTKTLTDTAKEIGESIIEGMAMGDLEIRKLLKRNGHLLNLTDVETLDGVQGKKDFFSQSITKDWTVRPAIMLREYVGLFGDKFKEYIKPGSYLGEYLKYTRILQDKSDLASNETTESAQRGLAALARKTDITVLEQDAQKYYDFMDKSLRMLVNYGTMSQEKYENIKKANTKYAFFQNAKAELDKITAKFSEFTAAPKGASTSSVAAAEKGMKGGTGDRRNPIAASVELIGKMGYTAEVNKYKIAFKDMLQSMDASEDVIRPVLDEKQKADPGYTRMVVLENSEYTPYDVKTSLMNEYESSINQLSKLRPEIQKVRPLFMMANKMLTVWNTSFTAKNLFKDIHEIYVTMRSGAIPGLSASDMRTYLKNLGTAYKLGFDAFVRGDTKAMDIIHNLEGVGAVQARDARWQDGEVKDYLSETTQKILGSLGVSLKDDVALEKSDLDKLKDMSLKVFRFPYTTLEKLNEIGEVASKMAFYDTMRSKGVAKERAAVYTRRHAGTIDSTYGGSQRVNIGMWFSFLNPNIQGHARMYHYLSRTNGLTGNAKTKLIVQNYSNILLRTDVLLGVMLPWALKNLWDDKDNPYKDVGSDALKRNFIIPFYGKEITLPKAPSLQVVHNFLWSMMDTSYQGLVKRDAETASRKMQEFLGYIFSMGGLTENNLNSILRIPLEWRINKNLFTGQKIHDDNNSEAVKWQKRLAHAAKSTVQGIIPKDVSLGFVRGSSGLKEKFIEQGREFAIRKADMNTEISKLYQGGVINPDRLRKLAGTEPSLITVAEKTIALIPQRTDVMKNLRKGNGLAYAKQITDMMKGKLGTEEGYQEIAPLLEEIQYKFKDKPEELKAIMSFIGVFGG